MNRGILITAALLFIYILSAGQAFPTPFQAAALTPEQDKAFSEFNHHVAGAFLLAIGIMAFLSSASERLFILKKIWPLFFIAPGVYLAFMSDPDVWPMGSQGLLDAFRTNPEAAEHKAYAAVLIGIGTVELQRGRKRLDRAVAAWAFPALAFFGAALLLFHKHGGGGNSMHSMHGMDMGAARDMLKIHREHLTFSILGAGIAAFKFVDDSGIWKSRAAPLIWPALISALGMLLLFYSE